MSDFPQELPIIPSRDSIVPITERQITEQRALLNSIVKSVDASSACFDNVVRPIADLANQQMGEKAVISALRYAAPEKETQHVVEDAKRLRSKYFAEVSNRLDYFQLLKAVAAKNEPLDPESAKMLKRKLMRYTMSGHGVLSEQDIDGCLKTKQDIEELEREFNRNIREYDAGGLYCTDEELRGVPSAELDAHPLNEDGKRYIPLQRRQYTAVRTHAHDANTRRKFQEAWVKKLPENIPVFRKAILLRDENARRLGYHSHAAMRMPYRMAESTEWVENLLEQLSMELLPIHYTEFKRIEAKKREVLLAGGSVDNPESIKIEPWDVSYYNHILQEEEPVDEDKISEFFPLEHTVATMLGMFSTFLQLRFDAVPKERLTGHIWTDDITVWSVWDERSESKGSFVGFLYVDVWERPNKYKGNQAVNLQPGYVQRDGSRVYPASTIMCNFSPLRLHGCPVLKHAQVKTLFHELGHCMHDLLARTQYEFFHGYAVCIEFGEAIGTMLENWCWMKEELQSMSRHYTRLSPEYMAAWMAANPGSEAPPETIPGELLENLLKKRPMSRISLHMGQLPDAKFDMAVHNPKSHADLVEMDETRLYEDINERFNFFRRAEPCYFHTTFMHLMSGYEAGYFAYLCANVFAEEMFQQNFAGRHRSTEAWDRFRTGILEHGGSRDEGEVLRAFLGRPPTIDALLHAVGVSK